MSNYGVKNSPNSISVGAPRPPIVGWGGEYLLPRPFPLDAFGDSQHRLPTGFTVKYRHAYNTCIAPKAAYGSCSGVFCHLIAVCGFWRYQVLHAGRYLTVKPVGRRCCESPKASRGKGLGSRYSPPQPTIGGLGASAEIEFCEFLMP